MKVPIEINVAYHVAIARKIHQPAFLAAHNHQPGTPDAHAAVITTKQPPGFRVALRAS